MIESERVVGKGRICATTEKLCERVPKNSRIRISTRNWYNPGDYREKLESERVPKNSKIMISTENWYNSSDYREKVESVRVPKNYLDEYRKMVESGSLPKNNRIQANTVKL